jgi:hypothetical protein
MAVGSKNEALGLPCSLDELQCVIICNEFAKAKYINLTKHQIFFKIKQTEKHDETQP